MNYQLEKILNHPNRVHVLVGVTSLGVGLGVGYILGRRNKIQNEVIIEEVSSQLAFDYETEVMELEVVEDEPEQVIDIGAAFVEGKLKEIVPHTEESEEAEPVRSNIFADSDDNEWDYKTELLKRNEHEPHVLHRDEFYDEEKGYSQITCTYYAGDNILVDQEDTPIYNHSSVVGALLFGHGSGDENVFYVRNDRRHTEYEIIRDEGLYSVEVLGLEIENNVRVEKLQHSAGIRKFKMD